MKQCPKCKSKNIIAMEYGYPCPESYDGISEYRCIDCQYRQGRWTGQELKDGEIESRYGKRGVIKTTSED
jgi:transposase-like protein